MNVVSTPIRWPRRPLLWGALAGLCTAGWLFLLRGHEPAPNFREPVADNFNAPALSSPWATAQREPGAVALQSAIVRAGARHAKITVPKGDPYEAADGHGGQVTERAELTQRGDLCPRKRQAAEYAFSVSLSPDFPIVPTRLVLPQWKQVNVWDPAPDSPFLALGYVDGESFFTSSITAERTKLCSSREELRGHWLDFVAAPRLSRPADGYVRMTINEWSIVDFYGANACAEAKNNARNGIVYLNMDLYRDRMAARTTACFDEFRKRRLPAGT